MAYDPRDVPAVGDEYGNGIVAKAVVTAEGIEITVRESRDAEDLPGGEDRPVSIPQLVDPSTLEYEGAEKRDDRTESTKDTAPVKPAPAPVAKSAPPKAGK